MSSPSHHEDGTELAAQIELPPEVWANVFENLPYQDILSCAATCRPFLHDAIPLLKTLHIDNSAEMNLTVASRFEEVQSIHINSLLQEGFDDDDDKIIEVDFESSHRIVPFLSSFKMLKSVYFGGKDLEGEILDTFSPIEGYFVPAEEEDDGTMTGGDRERMFSLIDSLSAAFRVGALSKTPRIYGLCCPKARSYGYYSSSCETCLRAAKSFPIDSVVAFESRGSSKGLRLYTLDVCLDRAKIEFIAESRPGGIDLLHSKDRLVRMLGSGTRYAIECDLGDSLYILKYKQSELNELKRVIEYAKLDVKEVDVKDAITKSLPSNCMWYLSDDSFDSLKELGFLMGDKDTLFGNVVDLVNTLPHISDVLKSDCDEYGEIKLDCFRLLRLALKDGSAIQPTIDLGLVPVLAQGLGLGIYKSANLKEIVTSLNSILVKGGKEQRSSVTGTEKIVYSLALCLYSTSVPAVECILSCLINIDICGTDEHIEVPSDGLIMRSLVRVLRWEHRSDVIIKDSLRLLVALTEHQIKEAMRAQLLPQVVQLIKTPTEAENLANCYILLRRMFDDVRRPIRETIDSGVVPMLVEAMKSEASSDTRTNLAHVMINLTKGWAKQTQRLLQEEGYISVLVSLIEFPDKDISHKAILRIGVIANTHPAVVSQLAIIETLLRLLQPSEEPDILMSVLSTLAKICEAKPADFASARSGVIVVAKLLVHSDSDLVLCALPALHCLLETFRGEDTDTEAVNAILNVDFVEPVIKLLGNKCLYVQGYAMKSIHLITTLSDTCIESVMQSNGLASIKDLLASPRGTNEMVHGQACKTLSIMFAGNKSRVQDAIDIGLIPIIIDMMSNVLFRVKKEALSVVYEAAKVASTEQLTHIGSHGCISHLFNMLTFDCINLSFVSLRILKYMSKAGKVSEADDPESNPPNIQLIEEKLDELIEENSRLEVELEREDLLSKKREWTFYDKQKLYVKSLDDTLGLLREQSLAVQQQLKSFEEKISTKRPLKPLCTALRQNQSDMKSLLGSHTSKLEVDRKIAATKLDLFLVSAQAAAPREKWEERLSKTDIPQDLAECKKAIYASIMVVESIKSTRLSAERKKDIETTKTGLEELFENEIAADTQEEEEEEEEEEDTNAATDEIPKKRKRSESVEAAVGVSLVTPPKNPKRNKESNTSSKKKVQSGIGRFFGASASKK